MRYTPSTAALLTVVACLGGCSSNGWQVERFEADEQARERTREGGDLIEQTTVRIEAAAMLDAYAAAYADTLGGEVRIGGEGVRLVSVPERDDVPAMLVRLERYPTGLLWLQAIDTEGVPLDARLRAKGAFNKVAAMAMIPGGPMAH